MSDNRIISRSEYIVASVSGAAIDNKIIKRPYTNPRNPSTKSKIMLNLLIILYIHQLHNHNQLTTKRLFPMN